MRLIQNFVDSQPRRPPAPACELHELTGREREVLQLLAQGRSNAEISTSLFIAWSRPPRPSVRRILQKLQLRDRIHAVVCGHENGLLTPGRS